MNSLILKTPSSLIDISDFDSCSIEVLDFTKNIDVDAWISSMVANLNEKHAVRNIFVPLCFGDVLSDYLGLRFALHIRTTLGINQLCNLFIYGVGNIESLYKNELVSIFKTKGVYLIDYNKILIKRKTLCNSVILKREELVAELNKMEIKIPDNLGSNHSVANIWGMHRLLELEGINLNEIPTLQSKRNGLNSAYFKWLVAKNNTGKLVNQEVKETRLVYADPLAGLKILGKMDLSPFESKKKRK